MLKQSYTLEALEDRRLLAWGRLDGNFGDNGVVVLPSAVDIESFQALAQQPDGKLLVAGGAVLAIGDVDHPRNDCALLRLNADGTYDTSFGDGGKVLTAGGDSIIAVAQLSDGKILAAGNAFSSSDDGDDIAL